MPFKINHLPEKYENIILPLMSINPKLVLGGSLTLYVLDIIGYDFDNRKPDLDFNLLEALTEEELMYIKDFFNLKFKINGHDYDFIPENSTHEPSYQYVKFKPISHFLSKDLIQLDKISEERIWEYEYTIDLFNSSYLPKKEHIIIKYKEFDLKLTHPSIILSHKSKYAYDPRVGKQYKHFQDLQKIDWKKYFQITKRFVANYTPNNSENFAYISHYYVREDLPFDITSSPSKNLLET